MTSDRRAFDAAKCSFSAAYDSTASGMAVCGTTGYSWFFYGYTYLIMSPVLYLDGWTQTACHKALPAALQPISGYH
jgi:hypothetical protein